MIELAQPVVQPQDDLAPPARVLILVDRATAHPRLLARLQESFRHSEILLLWVVTPSAVLTWGALLAEPVEERTHAMWAALALRMDEARRRLEPLQRAAYAAGLRLRTYIVHGAPAETLIRLASEEPMDRVLIPADSGALYGQPAQEWVAQLQRRLACPVAMLD